MTDKTTIIANGFPKLIDKRFKTISVVAILALAAVFYVGYTWAKQPTEMHTVRLDDLDRRVEAQWNNHQGNHEKLQEHLTVIREDQAALHAKLDLLIEHLLPKQGGTK